MARPARPPEEARAVREAAEIVRQETGLTAVSAISREIARRVIADLTTFIEPDADDPMTAALESVRLSLNPCPFNVLASDPEIDTLSLFINERISRLHCRNGQYLSEADQNLEIHAISEVLIVKLASRYGRQLQF